MMTSELTKLLAEATKAPWNIEGDGIYGKTSDGYTVQLFEYYAADEVARAEANARLIALAPELAARVVALDAENARLKTAPIPDDSISARVSDLGNQIHNLGCEYQCDEQLAERLCDLRTMAWDIARAALHPAPVAAKGE